MAINAINGISVSTSSTINGISGVDEVNGLELSGGGGPTLVKYEDFEAATGEYSALSALAGWSDKIAGIGVYWVGEVPALPKVAYPANATESLTYYSGGATALNQSVSFTFAAVATAASYIGPVVRLQAGSNDCYYVTTDGDAVYLVKTIGGTTTTLATATSQGLVAGNKIKLTVSGGSGATTRLTVQKDTGGGWSNITGLVSIDPSDYLGAGYGGIAGYGNNTSNTIDDWYWYND